LPVLLTLYCKNVECQLCGGTLINTIFFFTGLMKRERKRKKEPCINKNPTRMAGIL
jgi:hypothetical protein